MMRPLIASGDEFVVLQSPTDRPSPQLAQVRISLVGIAILFFMAATSKAISLIILPAIPGEWVEWRAVQGTLVVGEIWLAIWLLGTPRLLFASRVLRMLFVAMLAYSVIRLIQGSETCGCFGRVRVHPGWTMLLDVVCLVWLHCITPNRQSRPAQFARVKWQRVIPVIAVVSIPPLAWMAFVGTTVGNQSLARRSGHAMVLDPDGWVGSQLPIEGYVETTNAIRESLRRGRALVVLVRHDCVKCQEMMHLFQTLSGQDNTRVILVEVPPVASSGSVVTDGRLTADMEWFVPTPTAILLQDGVVLHVSHDAALSGQFLSKANTPSSR